MQLATHRLQLQAGILTTLSPSRIINAQERAAVLQALDGSAYQARLCCSLQPGALSAASQSGPCTEALASSPGLCAAQQLVAFPVALLDWVLHKCLLFGQHGLSAALQNGPK